MESSNPHQDMPHRTPCSRQSLNSAPERGPSSRLRRSLAIAMAVSIKLLCSHSVAAEASATPRAEIEAQLFSAVSRYVSTQTRELGQQVHIELPPLDARTRIRECDFYEVFLPPGSRLWGRGHVGVRCSSPAVWLIYLPVIVKVSGNYLLSTRKLNAGQILSDADLTLTRGELTQFPEGVLNEPGQAIGQRMRTGLIAHQALRRDHLVRTPLIRQGQAVKILIRGNGFSVSSEGMALTHGYENEVVKVKNAAGKTLQGRALSSTVVEISQ